MPPRGSRIAMTFGEPVELGHRPWPRTQQEMDAASERVSSRDPADDRATAEAGDRHDLAGPDPGPEA